MCIKDFSWFVYISLYADVRVELILLGRAEAEVGEVGARPHAKLGLEDLKMCGRGSWPRSEPKRFIRK